MASVMVLLRSGDSSSLEREAVSFGAIRGIGSVAVFVEEAVLQI